MLKNIAKLFKERHFLIDKQLTLARNMQHHYSANNTQKNLRDYSRLQHLQKEIQEKEKTISEYLKHQNK